MRFRTAALLTVAAAVSVETAVAPAQTDSTRRASSTRRIRISKEASGEVVSRVDTVTIYRSDTVRVSRVDTVAGPSYTRVDTVRIEPPPPPPLRQIGGLYFGLAGGAAIPTGDLDNAQRGGPHFDGVLGWDPMNMPLGLRLDGSFSRFDVISQFESLSSSPTILQLGLDGKLHLPTIMPWPQRMQVYAVGGASWNRFKDLVESGDGAITVGNSTTVGSVTTVDHDWHSKWGWNAGGGVQFGWGRTNLFVESRFMKFVNRLNVDQVPIVLGLSWY